MSRWTGCLGCGLPRASHCQDRAGADHDIRTCRLEHHEFVTQRKYRNRPCSAFGIAFASRAERERYAQLRILEWAGLIRDLEPHPRFDLVVQGPAGPVRVGRYTADSRYVVVKMPPLAPGEVVVEDVKSRPTMTTAARLRIRLYEALTGERVRLHGLA